MQCVTPYNISGFKQGETYTFLLTEFQDDGVTPLSNVGWTAKLEVRQYPGTTVIVELDPGTGLTQGGVNGETTVRFGADQTILMPANQVLQYDLRYVNNSDATDVRYPIGGTITAGQRITT